MPGAAAGAPAVFDSLSKAIRAGDAETAINPRARSATLRAATRTATAAITDRSMP